MLKLDDLAPFLRDPVTRNPVELTEDAAVVSTTGTRYFRDGNFIDFIAGEVIESSQNHYVKHPFDVVNYDDPEARLRAIDKELRELMLSISRDAIIFDLGCGPGRITMFLHEMGYKVAALDLSRRALQELRKRIDVPSLRADNLTLPFADEVADLVISTGVVHHTPDPQQAIAENCRILKPGGKLYLRLFNHDGYYRFMYNYLGCLMRGVRRIGFPGRLIVNGLLRPLYVMIRRRVTSDPVPKEKLEALFENYFMKDSVTLLRKAEVDARLATANMKILSYNVRSTMHCYIAEKRAGDSG